MRNYGAGSFFSDPFCLSVKYVVIDVGGSGGEPTYGVSLNHHLLLMLVQKDQ